MNKAFLPCLAMGAALSSAAWALPTLQLDILDGVYDPVTQTTVATSDQFTLIALLDPTKLDPGTPIYYISAAITPMIGSEVKDFGSFSIGGVTYGFGPGQTALNYGTPPVDEMYPNLPGHGIFPTAYAEIGFSFSGSMVAAYDTQTDALVSGSLLYADFLVDVSGLAEGYEVHFDLYDTYVKEMKKSPDQLLTGFAPPSHDAESGHSVPDGGGTVMLLGGSLAGLGLARRFLSRRAVA